MRAKCKRTAIAGDRAFAHARMCSVRPYLRNGIPRPGFDAQMLRALGEAEHQQRVRFVYADQARQIAINRAVTDIEDMRNQRHIRESRTPQRRQPQPTPPQ